jgi:hypothetical protein
MSRSKITTRWAILPGLLWGDVLDDFMKPFQLVVGLDSVVLYWLFLDFHSQLDSLL